jgi:hypothetical protein
MNFKDKHLVIVTWGDAYANLAYYEPNRGQDLTPMVIKDVGWICEENDECIVLCGSVSETGSQRNLAVIPNVNVISIEEFDFV